ncbi:TetR family transcriptional regulator [Thermosporothrix hazakensis]|jgi:AcrR family transcriptional regulator|uniref:TetR family transcriptional regulator n=1 Tax=Thermosporothrix hazakensis TaxID=644383 RepID=A0A326UM14_THEHA|nr:TetR/AcrR family transcriptional regulator [Thermosporothrix hazakensis]PZW34333.1 TetR family transcriptional regulator [Thermosporothrix hazakensis]GCE46118.1 TetR family transcriptional regulator [Thermosporothrix hazakensis]
MVQQKQQTPGRPRSEASHQAILQATIDVLKQQGYRATTIEAIAAEAGVGKKTIYRWWSSKAEVALEALTTHSNTHVPFLDTGSLQSDLLSYFERSFESLRGESGMLLRGIVAEALLDPAFAATFQRVFIVPRRASLVELLQRAQARGELTAETNIEVLADMIFGAKWYRFLLYPAPLDTTFAQEIVALVSRHRA